MPDAITARELQARRQAGEPFTLIDVREPWEHALAAIPGADLKPLDAIYRWAQELDRQGDYVVYCHTGVRSYYACTVLASMGFPSVKNLEGGIDAWSLEVDPTVPRY